MSIRSDVSINWSTSPRLLTVAAPSVEITVQDIVDTCRHFEDIYPNTGRAKLIDAVGKEFLGGTTYVGITATFQNAVIAFEARVGPDWVLCSILGGNIVAIDDLGADIDPRSPTAFITVDRTASSSATLQEQSALQYASFGGYVTIDVVGGTPGTDGLTGNIEFPVDNIPDALLIAADRGFNSLYFKEGTTISGVDITGFTIIGASCVHTQIVIDATAISDGITVKSCDLTGTIDGEIKILDCSVGDLINVNGCISGSRLYGTIMLGGAADSTISDCSMRDLAHIPTIDMGGSGQNIFLSDLSGALKVRNMTGAGNSIGIQLDGGRVFLESTISAGFVGVVGIGLCVDASMGTTVVDLSGLLSKDSIAGSMWDEDLSTYTTAGTAGKIVSSIRKAVDAIISFVS